MQDKELAPLLRERLTSTVLRKTKYRQAAVGYFIYGLIYLAGAVYLSTRNEGPDGWIWFGVGAGMAVLFPILIWMQLKWVTRILALLVGVRLLGLLRLIPGSGDRMIEAPWGAELPILYGTVAFMVVAGAECYLLVRAGWDL